MTPDPEPLTLQVPNDLVQIWADINQDPIWEGTVNEYGHLLRHIQGQTKTVYRIICPNFGTGHKTHVHTKRGMGLAEAKKRAEAQDRHYRRLTEYDAGSRRSFYKSEIGWKVQTQTVTEWEDMP